jgi:hypothetical protein
MHLYHGERQEERGADFTSRILPRPRQMRDVSGCLVIRPLGETIFRSSGFYERGLEHYARRLCY